MSCKAPTVGFLPAEPFTARVAFKDLHSSGKWVSTKRELVRPRQDDWCVPRLGPRRFWPDEAINFLPKFYDAVEHRRNIMATCFADYPVRPYSRIIDLFEIWVKHFTNLVFQSCICTRTRLCHLNISFHHLVGQPGICLEWSPARRRAPCSPDVHKIARPGEIFVVSVRELGKNENLDQGVPRWREEIFLDRFGHACCKKTVTQKTSKNSSEISQWTVEWPQKLIFPCWTLPELFGHSALTK